METPMPPSTPPPPSAPKGTARDFGNMLNERSIRSRSPWLKMKKKRDE